MQILRCFLLFVLCLTTYAVYAQQDIDFHLNSTFLEGKEILKVKRDFNDPYLWVLAQNNEVYRINCLTQSVDDYSNQFAAYKSLQFIDIAGRSKDTVFIATNSTNVLEYKKGLIKVLGTADGIAGTVNSVGIDNANQNNALLPNRHFALIATNNGVCRYDYQQETMMPVPKATASHIFEMTYRNEMLHGVEDCRCYPDTVEKYEATELVDYTIFTGELWLGGKSFGHSLRSAFFTKGSIFGNEYFVLFANHFWATENGLFQVNWNYSYTTQSAHNVYLKGININKITSIYGLESFASVHNFGGARENLLVGSDEGLYFSNSKYQNYSTPKYDFFHYDGLGNKKINDICVNATTYDVHSRNDGTICEDGVWVAAVDGLYLLKPDYALYINTAPKLQAIQFDGQAFNVSELQTCGTTTAKATVSSFSYTGNIVQWYKDGVELANESKTSLNISQAGDYYALLYDPCTGQHLETNHLKVSILPAATFTFNYPDQLNYCDGTTATLETDNKTNYLYRWYKDGSVLNGSTSYKLNITQNGKYKLEVSTCADSWVPTKEVMVNFFKLPLPVITATKPAYCTGDQAKLSIDVPADNSYTINWLLNGVVINNNQNQRTIVATAPGTYTVNISSNVSPCSQTSAGYALSFEDPPVVDLKQIINTTLCDGQTINLQATYTGGSVRWSTGETTDRITIEKSGTYTATVQTAAGCATSKDINVSFFPLPVLNMSDTTLCQFTNEHLTLTAPPGFAKYEWNGRIGGQTQVISSLGTVNLTVTDQNGCQASQTINISSHCTDIHIPNTFTPNGDGINDKWIISGLENDRNVHVSVYNRFGTLIFNSNNYNVPWDGTFQTQKVPVGVYYYVISTRRTNGVFSGSVTIIY